MHISAPLHLRTGPHDHAHILYILYLVYVMLSLPSTVIVYTTVRGLRVQSESLQGAARPFQAV